MIATKCDSYSVTDDSVDYPPEWQSGVSPSDSRGHQEHGRTIAVHSLAILPAFRNRGLGKIIMKSYRQRMEVSGIADRMSLVTHDHLIKFYEALRFVNKGSSQCTFAGGGWFDMVGLFIVSYDVTGSNGPVMRYNYIRLTVIRFANSP